MQPETLFSGIAPQAPQTEGVKYAGSKLKLLQPILDLASSVEASTVFDAFSGTSRVSQAFAKLGYRVIANDVAVWAEIFSKCYLLNREPREKFRDLIDHLNSVQPTNGWFTEHYGGHPDVTEADAVKRPWQQHNTRKLDGVRSEIERLNLGECEKAIAITSLILALDKVDSTLGHYASYLRKWSPRSFNTMQLEIPLLWQNQARHEVYRGDALDNAPLVKADLAYLDPPYGSNNEKMPPSRVRYSAYYHVFTTICLNDRPEVFGKVNRRTDSRDKEQPSAFESFQKDDVTGKYEAVVAIDRLLGNLNCSHAILSYSSGGRATAEDLQDVLQSRGSILEVQKINHRKNVMAGMRWTNDWIPKDDEPNQEFLFLIELKN